MTKSNSPFLNNFFGQIVVITTTQNISSTSITAEGPIVENYPYTLEGILLDKDHEYFYLTRRNDKITLLLDRTKIVAIEIVEPEEEKNVYTEVLEQMGSPGTNEEVN